MDTMINGLNWVVDNYPVLLVLAVMMLAMGGLWARGVAQGHAEAEARRIAESRKLWRARHINAEMRK